MHNVNSDLGCSTHSFSKSSAILSYAKLPFKASVLSIIGVVLTISIGRVGGYWIRQISRKDSHEALELPLIHRNPTL
jgi:hypothetical protein